MLITELKNKETILSLLEGKVFVIVCHGCREIHFPEHEADALLAELVAGGNVTGSITTDYICNVDNLKLRLQRHAAAIDSADTLLVLSCGVGVQTVAGLYPAKRVIAGCDTYALPGFQGVTPLEYDCRQCGECYLNLTGGICPITACSKSLVNGQCGGAKNGMCEVDPNMECGWERIQRRLAQIGRLDVLKCPVQVRNYATDDDVK
ncbi:MAG: methylenetetrahydrofolate reductase C-terminal domain-containing protein [Oscillospiraceae bacterium]|nr:methylenetetrahydrofolate reductase C-terminal domain-containing protein [Oscillospiraceae bacterium]